MKKPELLSGNALKIIAMVTMTMDHMGLVLLPGVPVLRVLGRLAMPIYAFLVAEGCRHTRDGNRYLGRLLGLGIVCQAVYYFATGSLYLSILITFSLSVGMILTAEQTRRTGKPAPAALCWAGTAALCLLGPRLLTGTDFGVDYGFFGVLLPVCGYFWGLPGFTGGLALLCLHFGGIQWWALGALPLLALYNGQRGRWKLGRFFYWYYPAHLVVIYGIGMLLESLSF